MEYFQTIKSRSFLTLTMNNFIIVNTSVHTIDASKSSFHLNEEWCLVVDSSFLTFSNAKKKIIIIGDYIGNEEDLFNTPDDEIPKLRGNFYAIVISQKAIKVYSSFLNILPIYVTTDTSIVASSIDAIQTISTQEFSLSKKYILENLLFNYSFFNSTKFKEIELVPCNTFILIELDQVSFCKHYSIVDLFVNSKTKNKKTADELSDFFIETAKHYFPNEPFDIAFTSGFDGRTLVSCATYFKKKFTTFSFGRPENDDVSIPKNNAAALNIPYRYYDLGSDEYIQKEYFKNAVEYTSSGYLGNGFIYAHFPFSAKKINENSNYLLSGACGSELFRALHGTGAVTSLALAEVFQTTNDEEIRNKLTHSKTLDVLNKDEFADDLNELISEVIEYKKQLPQNISINQQFYVFVFEEIFRKFFGQWVAIQQNYIKVRTPFLDFKFVSELLKTNYAGANNDFFTGNPFKRIKGQYIYADIIRKTNSIIYHQITGKGYRPKDVRNIFYMGNIVLPFIKKKLTKKVTKPFLDNLGIISGVQENKETLKQLISNTSFFNQDMLYDMLDELSPQTAEQQRDTLLMAISLIHNLQLKPVKRELLIL